MASLTEYQKDILIRTALSEAGGEGSEGMADVLHVILNRAASGKFPSDPAKVALQDKQFSSWNSGAGGNNPDKWSPGSAAYQKASAVLEQVASGSKPDQTGGALYFHTPAVSPSWAKSVNKNGKIERNGHVFYPTSDTAVATQLDTSRQSPTPAKQSAVMAASRNRQNLVPAADLAAKTAATPYLTKDGKGVTDPVDIVYGKQMTTALPQTPGQSQIERSQPRKVVSVPPQSVIERNPVSVKPGASQIERNPVAAVAPVAPPGVVRVADASAGNVALPAGVRPYIAPTSKSDPVGKMPAFGDVTMLKNSNIPGPVGPDKIEARLRPQSPLIDPGAVGKPVLTEKPNPAYARLMERVKQGEMSLNGLSRDSVDQRKAGQAAIDKLRAQIANTNKTIQVRNQTTRAAAAAPAVVPRTKTQLTAQQIAWANANARNQNAAALAAINNGQKSYTSSGGSLQPTVSMSGKIRNTYGD